MEQRIAGLPGPIAVVVAHPDDEVLGCGGLLGTLAARSHDVQVLCVTGHNWPGRTNEQNRARARNYHDALDVLGVKSRSLWDYNGCRLDVEPVHELADAIRTWIMTMPGGAGTVLTHWHGDVNQDHRRIAEAVYIACRPKTHLAWCPTLLLFEIPSSTDVSSRAFHPNVFMPVDEDALAKKKQAMLCYPSEYSSERSVGVIQALATLRGAQCGVRYAEGFQLARMRVDV